MSKYSNRKISFLGVSKAILSSGMIVNHWWENEDWNRKELLDFFDLEALKRGLDNSIKAGEKIPDKVYQEFPEFKK